MFGVAMVAFVVASLGGLLCYLILGPDIDVR